MNVYVYLDESGAIHKNHPSKYFVIGGYFVCNDKNQRAKIIGKYKKKNKGIKTKRGMPLDEELKSSCMVEEEKIQLISAVQTIDGFYGCGILFEKEKMVKAMDNESLFFNFGVSVLLNDCILPLLPKEQDIHFEISVDNRNTSVGKLKQLEDYLTTCYLLNGYTFKVTYYDSASHYGIQLADLIVNTFYLRSKNRELVKNLLSVIDIKKFRLNVFPGHGRFGRGKRIKIESTELTITSTNDTMKVK